MIKNTVFVFPFLKLKSLLVNAAPRRGGAFTTSVSVSDSKVMEWYKSDLSQQITFGLHQT